MKRTGIVLTLLALLGLAFAQGNLEPLPSDGRFDEPVEFTTGVSGESLPVMVIALARSVGLTAITDDVPNLTIVYDIGDPKPFRQVWNIVLTLNDLDYVLLENDVVVVGSSASVARLRSPVAADAPTSSSEPVAANREQRFYRVSGSVPGAIRILEVAGYDAEAIEGMQTLVVMATPDEHTQVGALLEQYASASERVPLEQRTYFLSNARAAELANVLQATRAAGEAGQAEAGAVERFSVVADARTNSVIVTGSASDQATMSQLIRELDQPQRQVNVQIRIQEVVKSVTYDLGLDVSGGLGQMSANILSTGLSFAFDTAAAVSGFNILAVLDALETQGLSRRVDDGNITVLDNQTGSLQAGGTIFISIAGASENIEREIPYGVQLEVTPRIANDGRVTLVINARVEDVLSNTNDPAFLELATRSMSSVVTLEPGQTALLGGLLQSNFTLTKNRIPVLGYIPIIGELFGSTTQKDENVDWLLVVNAMVIE